MRNPTKLPCPVGGGSGPHLIQDSLVMQSNMSLSAQQTAFGSVHSFSHSAPVLAGQLNANMQHNRANGDTSTKIGVMTP